MKPHQDHIQSSIGPHVSGSSLKLTLRHLRGVFIFSTKKKVAVICTVAFPVFVASVVEVKITALPMVLPTQGARLCHGDSMGGSRGFFC